MRQYTYEEVLAACATGEYPSCEIRSASGRLNRLLGLTPRQYDRIKALAVERGVGLLLVGSRVSGPRARQRTLHPALACLPLATDHRAASALDPGAKGVSIDKTVIKEYGKDDPRTSDLTVVLIDGRRADAEVAALAVELEALLNSLGLSFRVRVFSRLHRGRWRSEADFRAEGEGYLLSLAPDAPYTSEERREAVAELYHPVNLPRPLLARADWRNAALTATLLSASFSLGLGFHWILPLVGFVFGLFGRYLSRLRAATARALGDAWLGNGVALAVDAAIGASMMGFLVVPAAGLPITWSAILAGSATHTLAKGTMRLWLDKRYAAGTVSRQARGVAAVSALNFAQGVVTSFVYAGSRAAWLIQLAVCVAGAVLLFGPLLRRAALPSEPAPAA
ncbi:MAG: hypothetical protein SF051_08300 [Elusimicrobiota bacterium]|nr:hypothetical protein [Elusimicrobiota bacterium]